MFQPQLCVSPISRFAHSNLFRGMESLSPRSSRCSFLPIFSIENLVGLLPGCQDGLVADWNSKNDPFKHICAGDFIFQASGLELLRGLGAGQVAAGSAGLLPGCYNLLQLISLSSGNTMKSPIEQVHMGPVPQFHMFFLTGE